MKNQMIMNNKSNNHKGTNQNQNLIHPKKLFQPDNTNNNMNNNSKNVINHKNNNIKNYNKSSNNSITKINDSNSNKSIYNDINSNNSNINNLSKNINSDKNIKIYLYSNNNINRNNNYNNSKNNSKKLSENIGINDSPEIIKKSSTTMKNKNNSQNSNNTDIDMNSNNSKKNNRNSINGNNQLIFQKINNNINNDNGTSICDENNSANIIYNLKKIENKILINKISNKVLKKNYYNIYKNNNKTNNNNNNSNNKMEDTFMDGQIPTVADENPNVNSLKIMKFNKCIYTNQIISKKFVKILSINKICDSIFIFLTGNDLYNLSLVNKYFNDHTNSAIYKIIIYKIIKNNDKTIKNIWNEIKNNSILNKNNKNNIFNSNKKNNKINDIYLNYLNYSNKYDEDIIKDLSRTLPNNILFKKDSNNYKKLFNVLRAYSNYNKTIGYAQGMNFIVAKLIIFCNTELESFLNLDAIFCKLNFSDVIGVSNGLEQKMYIIQFLLQKYSPKIIKYFEEKKINHEIFTVSWIITLFTKSFENNKLLLIIWNFQLFLDGNLYIYLLLLLLFTFKKNI